MELERSLRELQEEFDRMWGDLEGFFSPGWDKYTGYGSFAGHFATDMDLAGEQIVPELERVEPSSVTFEEPPEERMKEEAEEDFRKRASGYRPLMLPYPGIEIRRVAAHELGYGVLGRCFPYAGIIEIRSDLYGDEFAEVLTHELTHMANPQWSELDVRTATRNKLPFTPKWH